MTDGQRPGREPIAALAIALLLVALPAAGQQTAPDGGDASSAPLAETARGLIDPPPGPGQRPQILDELRRANRYFMQRWPDPGAIIVTNRARPSNIWTRAVYYEGLLALYQLDPRREYYDYAVAWGEAHDWGLRDGDSLTRDADNQAAGQIYLDLYAIDPQAERIRAIRTSIDAMLASDRIDDWNWIDALQMAMPVFARFAILDDNPAYLERMQAMYRFTRDVHGDNGLFNPADGLWWRDADFDPPQTSPNGRNVYWSRGNGWVLMGLARVLDILPADAPQREGLAADFITMARALVPLQRNDGFWNVNLDDPEHFGGPEASGTAMFVYGLAWGINAGLLDRDDYLPTVARGWQALSTEALQADGSLGLVQSTGKEPADGQPVTRSSRPDFEDFGLGAFLLAGSEVYRLAR